MKTLFAFVFLLLSVVTLRAQIVKLESMEYLGFVLIDEPSTANMEKTCIYYGLDQQESEEDFMVFTSSDSKIKIRFKIDKSPKGNIPEVQVFTNDNPSNIHKMLSDTGFEKENGAYMKGSKYANRRTKCTVKSGSPTILTFSKVYTN